ncbi:MAG: hypothetical protein NVS4B6_31710 [Mycobacterium sp.]
MWAALEAGTEELLVTVAGVVLCACWGLLVLLQAVTVTTAATAAARIVRNRFFMGD